MLFCDVIQDQNQMNLGGSVGTWEGDAVTRNWVAHAVYMEHHTEHRRFETNREIVAKLKPLKRERRSKTASGSAEPSHRMIERMIQQIHVPGPFSGGPFSRCQTSCLCQILCKPEAEVSTQLYSRVQQTAALNSVLGIGIWYPIGNDNSNCSSRASGTMI
jgi:hypothetical protein